MIEKHDERVFRNASWWFSCLRFIGIHLLCLLAFWVGFDWVDVAICAAFYVMHLFFVTAGYHRYFSHRTYKMGRIAQFLMAWGAQQTAQKGVLWWASHHRHHHKYSDQPNDVHSVRQGGFFWAHVGWIFHPQWEATEMDRVKDLAKFPELVWLNRNPFLPPLVLATICFLAGGWQGIIVWFLWSLVAAWHGTFTINSLSHVFGSQRYDTGDDSRNNWLLAIITLGEGWHNNHHHFQASVRQGFFWWEYDFTYYALVGLSKLGIVSDLKQPPKHVVLNRKHPMKELIERARASAAQIQEDARLKLEELKARQETSYREALESWESAKQTAQEGANRRLENATAIVESAMGALEVAVSDLSDQYAKKSAEILESARSSLREIHHSIDEKQRGAKRAISEVQDAARRAFDELNDEASTISEQLDAYWPAELTARPTS